MFSDTYLLKEHEKIHKNESSNALGSTQADGSYGYKCPKCSKIFKRSGQILQWHIRKCSGQYEGRVQIQYRYRCVECKKAFGSKLLCADHMALIHKIFINNVDKFCFICNAEFDDPFKHSKTHNCPFQCTFVRKLNLMMFSLIRFSFRSATNASSVKRFSTTTCTRGIQLAMIDRSRVNCAPPHSKPKTIWALI